MVLADGRKQTANEVVKNVKIKIAEGVECQRDLVVLPVGDQYDVILGMPFLQDEDPKISWKQQTMTMTDSSGRPMTIATTAKKNKQQTTTTRRMNSRNRMTNQQQQNRRDRWPSIWHRCDQ